MFNRHRVITVPMTDVVKKALEKRKVADLSFRQQFFGRASKEYEEASSMVTDLLSEADKRLERVLTTDPGTGVMRHVDAGYETAKKIAKERNVKVGLVEGL